MIQAWSPGDYTASGILMALGYLLAAIASWRVSQIAHAPPGASGRYLRLAGTRRWFWRGMALVMLLMAIERQVNLTPLVTDEIRAKAMRFGLYRERRDIQEPAAIGLTTAGAIMLPILIYALRRTGYWAWAAITGAVFLVTFLFVRAVSLHVVDDALWSMLLGLRLKNLVEAGGIALVTIAAIGGRSTLRKEMQLARLRTLAHMQRRRREKAAAEAAAATQPIEP